MAGVMQDDAKLHKFCRDGKIEKIKVDVPHLVFFLHNPSSPYVHNIIKSFFHVGFCCHCRA